MNRADFLHVRAATKDGTPIAGVLVEVIDGDGRIVTDGLSNDVGTIRLRLPPPPVYIVRSTDANGTVRETRVGARSGVHLEHIVNPPLNAETHNQKVGP